MAYTDKTFFATIKPFVIADMKTNRILASLTASQAFIESNKGNSGLTVKCNNLFGIKGKYNGQSGRFLTTEYYNGVKQRVYADFRKYPTWQESIADHSSLFNRLERYKNLRGEKNYVTACINVKNDGYATSPTYTKTLIDCIEKYKLYEWDSEVSGIVVQKTEILEYPTLKLGSHNEYVLAWQKYLNLSGFPCGLEDGIFGRNKLIAVKDYQESIGLVADGVIGLKTWKSIK